MRVHTYQLAHDVSYLKYTTMKYIYCDLYANSGINTSDEQMAGIAGWGAKMLAAQLYS